MREIDKVRLGLFPVLAEQGPPGHIGRTALMKYLYFLQTIRGVPLGYSFSMYSYGPFDSEVLADLSTAEVLGIVEVTPIEFPGGYGYRIKPGPQAEPAKRAASQFLTQYRDDVNWLFSVFGGFNNAELELTSTIVYVDREFTEQKQGGSTSKITERVLEIKPRFTQGHVQMLVDLLYNKYVLTSVLGIRAAQTN
jgi:uncharacterized protein